MAHLYNRRKKKPTAAEESRRSNDVSITTIENGDGTDDSTTLLVSRISPYTREEQLYELFGKCGEIKKLVPCIDNFRNPTGDCFVEFFNRQSAADALQYLDGVKLDGCELKIKWDTAFQEGRQYIRPSGILHPLLPHQLMQYPGYGGRGRGADYSTGTYRGRGRGMYRGGRGGYRGRGGGGGRGGAPFIPDYELDNDSIRIEPMVFVVDDDSTQFDELPSVDRLIKRGNFGTVPKDSELHRKKAESRGEEVIESETTADEGSLPKMDDDMKLIKKDLNSTKHTLDEFNGVEWSKHTAVTNRSANVVREVRTKCRGEMVDSTWLKLYELLSYRITDESGDEGMIPKEAIERGRVNSLFINETRGSLAASLNHYIKNNYVDSESGRSKVHVEWFSIYNEQQEGVTKIVNNDKRFMDLTQAHWLNQAEAAPQGEEPLSGDITKKDNIEALWKRLDTMEYKPDIVVADGSVNVWDNPAEQENLVSRLKWCEAISMLGVLSRGGSLVLKYFTTFEYSSIALLFLLRTLFDRVLILKPYTIKESNSEVYIVCRDFKPATDLDLRGYLLEMFDAIAEDQEQGVNNMAPIRVHSDQIPQSFVKALVSCAKDFAEQQMQAIERNVALFGDMTQEERAAILKLRLQTAHEFIKQMKVRHLSNDSDRIVKMQHLDGSYSFNPDARPAWAPAPRRPMTGHKRTYEEVQREGEREAFRRDDDGSDDDSSVYSSDDEEETSHRRKRRRE